MPDQKRCFQFHTSIPERVSEKIHWLVTKCGYSKQQILINGVERMYREEMEAKKEKKA